MNFLKKIEFPNELTVLLFFKWNIKFKKQAYITKVFKLVWYEQRYKKKNVIIF